MTLAPQSANLQAGETALHAIRKPYLLVVGDMEDRDHAKTALGLRDWCPQDCIGQLRLTDAAIDLGLPDMTPRQARESGAGTAVLGITPAGGALPRNWLSILLAALEAGLDIASGLHMRLADIPEVAARARALGRSLHDVRHNSVEFQVGSGLRRPGKRMLMVGTDCAVGKKYSALSIAQALKARGRDVTFRATGQTGVLIAGRGVVIDTVPVDFASGAAEALSPANDPGHWDIIEGQGSLFHPSFAAVTLGLVHGSQPDLMVLCHDPARPHIADHPDYPIPTLPAAVAAYTQAARLTNTAARVGGIALNTAAFAAEEARDLMTQARRETGLPAVDPMRGGLETFLDALDL